MKDVFFLHVVILHSQEHFPARSNIAFALIVKTSLVFHKTFKSGTQMDMICYCYAPNICLSHMGIC